LERSGPHAVVDQNKRKESLMYIGLGGILILILVLWLLGVI
jgi:hypothetical protein